MKRMKGFSFFSSIKEYFWIESCLSSLDIQIKDILCYRYFQWRQETCFCRLTFFGLNIMRDLFCSLYQKFLKVWWRQHQPNLKSIRIMLGVFTNEGMTCVDVTHWSPKIELTPESFQWLIKNIFGVKIEKSTEGKEMFFFVMKRGKEVINASYPGCLIEVKGETLITSCVKFPPTFSAEIDWEIFLMRRSNENRSCSGFPINLARIIVIKELGTCFSSPSLYPVSVSLSFLTQVKQEREREML